MADDTLAVEADAWTWAEMVGALDRIAEHIGEWQGIPVPLDGDYELRLADGHPLAGFYPSTTPVEIVVGGPPLDTPVPADASSDEILAACTATWEGERVVNRWYDGRRNRDVFIFQRATGRAFAVAQQRAPDRSMDRLTLALRTLGASDAWTLDAESTAIEKLETHVTERQLRHYLLTGMFLETSARSGLTYVFRRLRPTVAMTARQPWWRDRGDDPPMRVLAVLCMHPIGYYDQTWAGCMVPTDDVLAHLLLMRGDEAGFWRHANQHDAASPEAGL